MPMSPTALRLPIEIYQAPAPALTEDWRGALNALRVTALNCRVAARDDLTRACALLAQSKQQAQGAYAGALVRCLTEALGKAPVFFRPGEAELSFDEAWLTRLLMATASGDQDSLAFLIRSRVPRIYQRNIAFLIKGTAEQFGIS
ncbi:MAG: hypothetical protein AAFU41_13405 [Pseudomonadota bacterium]